MYKNIILWVYSYVFQIAELKDKLKESEEQPKSSDGDVIMNGPFMQELERWDWNYYV